MTGFYELEEDFNKALDDIGFDGGDMSELSTEEMQTILRKGLVDNTIDITMGTMIQGRIDRGKQLTNTMMNAIQRAGNHALQKSGREERIHLVDDGGAREAGRSFNRNPLEKSHDFEDRYGNAINVTGREILERCQELVKSRAMDLTTAGVIEGRINKGKLIEEDTLRRMFKDSL